MTPLTVAYDTIRLIRRKVDIAQKDIVRLSPGPRRDEAIRRASILTDELVSALQSFAECGFEQEVATLLIQQKPFPFTGRAEHVT